MDRHLATTTGRMLEHSFDTPSASYLPSLATIPPLVVNRRCPKVSNRISEHDNRNDTQNFGEYFGQGYGKRVIPPITTYDHKWIFSAQPQPVHPDRSITQRDYRGWPSLTDPRSSMVSTADRYKPSGEWMASSYDDFRRDHERLPSELIYRNDYKHIPIHPWHY